MSTNPKFIIHSFEQILRFTRVPWSNLSSDRREQLYFNVGALAGLLDLGKESSYDIIGQFRVGDMSSKEIEIYFREMAKGMSTKMQLLMALSEDNINRDF